MGITIGLDIGTVSLKLAALGEGIEDQTVLDHLCAANTTFRLIPGGIPGTAAPLVLSSYLRITGSPVHAAANLLEEFLRVVPETLVDRLQVTGSGGIALAKLLGLQAESEFKAISRMMTEWYPEVRTVFEIGCRTFKYIPLKRDGDRTAGADHDSGGCEEGMGAFLEQQASRMGLTLQAMGDAAGAAERAPRISSHCSVFIKSDMIHAQQKGHTQDEVLRALCETVAAKFRNRVVKSQPVAAPVAFIGSVSQNTGVARALEDTFQLKADELVVPDLYAWCGAIGTAMLAAESEDRHGEGVAFAEIRRLSQQETAPSADDIPPLSLEQVTLLGDSVQPYVAPPGNKLITAYLGIDVGSVSTKLAVIDDTGTLIHEVYLPTAGMPVEAVRQGLKEIDRLWGHRLEIHGVGTTGSGRELIAEFIGADVVHDEITAHKTGAFHISRLLGGEPVDTIFEIGGQDAKFISMDNGVVTDFAMNDACAAGTGSFLEEQADMLGISIRDEFAKLALTAPAPARLGEFCTVATGNTLNARIQTGETMPNLLAGLACAVARNYVNLVVRRRPIGKVIYFQGGTASNRAVAAAFAGLLGRKIIVPPHNRVIGAIGVALIALEWSRTTGENTRFRGYRLAELHGNVRNFVCQACNNQCDVKEFTIEGNKSYWGGKCSDRYSQPAFSGRRPVIRDLIAYREELFDEITAGGVEGGRFRIGLPRALTHFDLYPFWHCYISQLGMQVVLSPASDPKITENVFEIIAAPFCLPIRVALGHVRALTETEVDHILLPSIDRTEITGEDDAQSCLWTRTLPHALACSAALEPHKDKLLIPTISFREGPEQVKDALYAVMAGLGVSRNDNDRAVDEAYAAQKAFQNKLLAAGRTALEQLAETGEPGLVLAGRSYNLYDRTINCDVPRKLRARYGANVIPFDFLAMGHERDGSFRENLPWEAGKRILATAELTATWDNLHLIQTSHFSCVPDAGTRRIARQTAGRPLLFLQFDGHGWDAGYMTRCEAFLDSKGILRCYTAAAAPEEVAAPC